MVDFDDLLADDNNPPLTEPIPLFKELLRDSRFSSLRGDQHSILERWYHRKDQPDTLIKMNTGSGKTLVGLVIAQSSLNESQGPVLYLCPDKTLARQAAEQASLLGVSAFLDEGGALPSDFLAGATILVTTFQRLFNAKSKFGLRKDPRGIVDVGTIILDDAHTCLTIARESSTIKIPRDSKFGKWFMRRFQQEFVLQSPGTAADLQNARPGVYQALPYWAWQDSLKEIADRLSKLADSEELEWVWPLVKSSLATMTAVVGHKTIEISSMLTPTAMVPTLTQAGRRVYLTATLVDDSSLVTDIGVSVDDVSNPLSPSSYGDIGERMILAPSLISPYIKTADVAKYASEVAASGENVVVLVPSFKEAKIWIDAGAKLSEKQGPVDKAVKKLRSSRGNFVVLGNRYDGIDLPDDACRLLILDGLPRGVSLREQNIASARPESRAVLSSLTQRVEQGLGRAVRSQSDYAAVLLCGAQLGNFIGNQKVLNMFSPETRSQIEMCLTLSKKIGPIGGIGGIRDTVRQLLTRDSGWRKYHGAKLVRSNHVQYDAVPLSLAQAEREAHLLFESREDVSASEVIAAALDLASPESSTRGWYLQLQGEYLHRASPGDAQQKQRSAHKANRNLLIPTGAIRYKKFLKKKGPQAQAVTNWVKNCVNSNAVILRLQQAVVGIAFGAESEACERSLAELGQLLGFASTRPEKELGKGPDVLWVPADGPALVWEAKSEVLLSRSSISKTESGQLANSTTWFKDERPNREVIPVLFHPVRLLDSEAYPPPGLRVLCQENLSLFLTAIQNFGDGLAALEPHAWTVPKVNSLLTHHRLTGKSIVERFLPVKR